jgi:hypothetical protein
VNAINQHGWFVLWEAIGYITPKEMLAGHQEAIQAERDRKLEAAREQRKGKASTTASQNGQSESHDHPKGASATCGWRDGAGGLSFRIKAKLKTEIPACSSAAPA